MTKSTGNSEVAALAAAAAQHAPRTTSSGQIKTKKSRKNSQKIVNKTNKGSLGDQKSHELGRPVKTNGQATQAKTQFEQNSKLSIPSEKSFKVAGAKTSTHLTFGQEGTKKVQPQKAGTGALADFDGPWYDHLNSLVAPPKKKSKNKGKSKNVSAHFEKADDLTVLSSRKKAEKLLSSEVNAWETSKNQSTLSDDKWLRTVLVSGTLSDKVAAMTLMIQESPLHNIKQLDALLLLATKEARRERQMAVESLKDLFLTNLLPTDRKLRRFGDQNLTSDQVTGDVLAYYLFEDMLKSRYTTFIGCLESCLHDSMQHFRSLALRSVYSLLVERPEQEAALLTLLVNKLGDAERKIASKASYFLQQLAEKHGAMKPAIVREVQQFLLRPTISQRARYYGVLFLSQMPLVRGWTQLADEVVAVYFTMFEKCVHNDEVGTKLLSALLTGVNRAFPYTSATHSSENKSSDSVNIVDILEEKSNLLFGLVHKTTFNTSVQALALLFQIATTRESFRDRFYTTLYATLLRPELAYTTKHHLYLNLLYRAIKADNNIGRVQAFVKRIVQVALHMPASFAAATIYLIAELFQATPRSRTILTQPETTLALHVHPGSRNVQDHTVSNEEHASSDKVEVEQNDVASETVTDHDDFDDSSSVASSVSRESSVSDEIVTAENKRMTSFVDQLLGSEPEVQTTNIATLDDDDNDNNNDDSNKVNEEENHDSSSESEDTLNNDTTDHASTASVEEEKVTEKRQNSNKLYHQEYDAHKRNPAFAAAQNSCLYELAPLAAHYHPSVRRFAESVMQNGSRGKSVQYGGDPLADFTLMAFLDRFVYKNPKQRLLTAADTSKETELTELEEGYAEVAGKSESMRRMKKGLLKGASIMQPRGKDIKRGRVALEKPPTAPEFLQQNPEDVREDDQFYFEYFRTKSDREEKNSSRTKRKETVEGDLDTMFDPEVADEEEEEFAQSLAENLMTKAHGRVDMDDDDDDDDDDAFAEFAYSDEHARQAVQQGSLDAAPLAGENKSDTEDNDGDEDIDEFSSIFLRQENADAATDAIYDHPSDEVAMGAKNMKMSAFADADEYAHILGKDDLHAGADQSTRPSSGDAFLGLRKHGKKRMNSASSANFRSKHPKKHRTSRKRT